jgi:hypothetical protein
LACVRGISQRQPVPLRKSLLYIHPASGALYVLTTGSSDDTASSLQRLVASWNFGPPVQLPARAKLGAVAALKGLLKAGAAVGEDPHNTTTVLSALLVRAEDGNREGLARLMVLAFVT